MEGKVQGSQNINWWVENRQGDVKNSKGNGVAKELMCMTHGHELSGGGDGQREWGYQSEQDKRGKTGTTVIA